MTTYKPNLPEGIRSEKQLYELSMQWKKSQIAERFLGKYPEDYYFIAKLNELQYNRNESAR